jgi:uncharacterized repeat protein (TIGR03803 family)
LPNPLRARAELSFCSQSGCRDGADSVAGLVQGTDGNLYGTTQNGGANDACSVVGCGTVFKISPSGTLTTLYSFCSQSGCTDGYRPVAGLIQGADGNFYGTTQFGGASGACTGGCGTVFKITPSGTLTTLHSFDGTDGNDLFFAGLIQATDGNLYGATYLGGANGTNTGTVFKITPSGALTTLYNFCSQSGCTDGRYPYGGLVQATDGILYGTTQTGGANGTNAGTVFKITPSGTLTTLYSFCAETGCTDGYDPTAALVQATNGNFYGTTTFGGADGDGTVFILTVQTPQQATQAIINSVNALFSQGVLNGGQDNSLVVKLQHAINLINAGNDAAAIGNLNAFIGEVNDLLASGVLTPSQAASLISAAESVIARL